MEIIFWLSTALIFYVFIGYPLLMTILTSFQKRIIVEDMEVNKLPALTLVVAAYNEEEIIAEKLDNLLALSYPSHKINIMVVTDGSTDQTNEIVAKYPQVKLYFQPERKGKIAALNRIMPCIESPITVFSDANVMLNPAALKMMVRHFKDSNVAVVSGEKKVISQKSDGASSSGEGFYWKYESYLKKCDANWNTLVGSAGELYAMRTSLYEKIEEGTLIEDFVMTMQLAAKGYKIAYEPQAYAMETGSANIAEETKRKVRISAGGIQAVIRLLPLLNFLKYGKLSFQYISHRVLRWTLMPIAIISAFITNLALLSQDPIYEITGGLQLIFYSLSFIGYALKNSKTKIKVVYLPFYFLYMHYCLILGWLAYIKGNQKVTWEKARRAQMPLKQIKALD